MTETDRELHELFDALRRRTTAQTPAFQTTLAGARRRPTTPRVSGLMRLAAAVAAAVVLALLAVTWLGRREPRSAVIDLAAARLQAPTDFLLRTPGADLLRTVPEVGTTTLGRSLP